MIITGCETCEKLWEECCGKGFSKEEIERINKEIEKLSPTGGMVDAHG